MLGINKIFLIGQVAKDPEIRHLESGKTYAQLTLTTARSYTNPQGEKIASTIWHNIVLWGNLAETTEKHIKKGMLLYIEGWLNKRNYLDKENRNKEAIEIIALNFRFMGSRDQAEEAAQMLEGLNTSINKIILLGHVGKDPEMRYLEGGKARAQMSLATSRSYTNNQGEKIASTIWHNIVLWGNLAETAEKHIKKGSLLYVEGWLNKRNYLDKDGVNKDITETIATMLCLAGRKEKIEAGVNFSEADLDTQEDASNKLPF